MYQTKKRGTSANHSPTATCRREIWPSPMVESPSRAYTSTSSQTATRAMFIRKTASWYAPACSECAAKYDERRLRSQMMPLIASPSRKPIPKKPNAMLA